MTTIQTILTRHTSSIQRSDPKNEEGLELAISIFEYHSSHTTPLIQQLLQPLLSTQDATLPVENFMNSQDIEVPEEEESTEPSKQPAEPSKLW